MAFIQTSIYSQVLDQRVPVDLFLPTDRKSGTPKPPRAVIYFLHGITQNEKEFQNFTAANRYAMENHVAMVYVNAPYSFYHNMPGGFAYYTYLTEELPQLLNQMFILPQKREKTFIAGLSMGGYGALKLGLSRPDLYGACAAFSGSLDMGGMVEAARQDEEIKKMFSPIFGQELEFPQESDLFYLVKNMSKLPPEEQSRVLVCCGKQDHGYAIYQQNQNFNQIAKELPLTSYKFMQWDGAHDHSFWDRAMLHAMAFFLKNHYDNKKIQLWRSEAE